MGFINLPDSDMSPLTPSMVALTIGITIARLSDLSPTARFLLHSLALSLSTNLFSLIFSLPLLLLHYLLHPAITALRAIPLIVSIPVAMFLLLIYLTPIRPPSANLADPPVDPNQAIDLILNRPINQNPGPEPLDQQCATLAQDIEILHHYLGQTRNGNGRDRDRDRVVDNLPFELAT